MRSMLPSAPKALYQPLSDRSQNISSGAPGAMMDYSLKQETYRSENAPKVKCRTEPILSAYDIAAVIVSLLSLLFAVLTISPSISWAVRLSYTGQIIVIGFLLGIMNQAMSRVLPFFCLVVERRVGDSSLQNFDGLLRWSPVATGMSFIWRTLIILSIAIPLVLSVLYKRYTGGVSTVYLADVQSCTGPAAPPGLQGMPGLTIMANATLPFLQGSGQANDSEAYYSVVNRPYGYNLLQISNRKAAALDIPEPQVISGLQDDLQMGQAYYLDFSGRGSLATEVNIDSDRKSAAFWNKFKLAPFQFNPLWDGFYFGMLNLGGAIDSSLKAWDDSWIFLGSFNGSTSNSSVVPPGFAERALAFHVKRHQCSGTLKITRASVDLVRGECSSDPLPWQYQYFENAQLALAQWYFQMALQILGLKSEPESLRQIGTNWLVPTYAMVVASMYESRLAQSNGLCPVQIGGPLYEFWRTHSNESGAPSLTDNISEPLKERYLVTGNRLRKTGQTLRPDASLYFILTIQPLITVLAFLGPLFVALNMRRNQLRPGRLTIPRAFNMIALLAGVDRDSLDVFGDEDKAAINKTTLTGTTAQGIGVDFQFVQDQQCANVINEKNELLDSQGLTPGKGLDTSYAGVRYTLSKR